MAARFWVGSSGSWDATNTTNWSSVSGGPSGASVPTSADTATFDAASGGGTVTIGTSINSNNTVSSITMGAFTGTITNATNNTSITTGSFSGTGTGTRTLTLGTATYTITGVNATIWDFQTTTNLTLTASQCTITFATSNVIGTRQLSGGGKAYGTFNALTATNSITTTPTITITGNNSFVALNVTTPNWLRLPSGGTTTISNAFNWVGSASSNAIMIDGGTGATTTINTTQANTINWGVITGVISSGGGTITATNSIDGQANTGITITGPSGATSIIGS